MAEGWATELHSNWLEAYSAGIETHGLNPNAVKVMKEAGVDISSQESTNVSSYENSHFDLVITVCGHAQEVCPHFSGAKKQVHVAFEDPPKLALEAKTEEEALGHYRKVRDQIKEFVEDLPSHFDLKQ